MSNHQDYMQLALDLAKNAIGRTSPNPLVGAVLVKAGRIIGCGWHQRAGAPHAEINAIAQAGDAAGATLYVTLEPCSHYGRTPPCCDALIQANVQHVVIATLDPNPLVAGRGAAKLRAAGLTVEIGCLEKEARQLNQVFFKWITQKQPWLTLKCAMSLDGKTATTAGESKWITSTEARCYGHKLRDTHDAIMVGINTILADNPSLTARLPQGGRNPIRIIVDSTARLPLDANVVTDQKAPTILATTQRASAERLQSLEKASVKILLCPMSIDGHVDLQELCRKLGEQSICSILVEGGATLLGALVSQRLGDFAYFFIAPKLLGGRTAQPAIGGSGIAALSDAVELVDKTVENVGCDLLVKGYLRKDSPSCLQV